MPIALSEFGMNENTTTAIKRYVIQRIKRLTPKNMFVPAGLLFEKLLEGMTDEQLIGLILTVRKEYVLVREQRELAKYNYVKPKPETKPQPFIYSEPLAQ